MNESENVRKAIDRIDGEAGTDPTLNYLAEMVREMIRGSEDFAAAVVKAPLLTKTKNDKGKTDEKGKSLKGALEAMRQEASPKKSGGSYAMGDAEARKIVAKYYGISDIGETAPTLKQSESITDSDDFDLFDMI